MPRPSPGATTAPRVVIAPDKFKGSLSAAAVADAVAAGISAARPDVQVGCLPVADGGDGTVDAAVAAGYERMVVDAVGPTGDPVVTSYARQGDRAVIELASSVGLSALTGGVFDPMGSSTYGLGLVLGAALDAGARSIVLGIGGSASTDGGAGMLQALGGRLLDEESNEIPRGGAGRARLASVDLEPVRRGLAGVCVALATDVDNPLLGPSGAARVFAPQKGATQAQVAELERGLAHWAEVLAAATGRDCAAAPGAGAAGGTGLAALAVLGAEARPGIEVVLDLIGFSTAVTGSSLVVTGEGSLDAQSLGGKAPVGVAQAVLAAGVAAPLVAVAGRCLLSQAQLAEAGISAVYPLSALEPDVARSMAGAAGLLTAVGTNIADGWLP
jgi:glycerate kinase